MKNELIFFSELSNNYIDPRPNPEEALLNSESLLEYDMQCLKCKSDKSYIKPKKRSDGIIIHEEICCSCHKRIRTVRGPASEFVMPYGKYKSFKLHEIFTIDSTYISWAKKNIDDKVGERIKEFLHEREINS